MLVPNCTLKSTHSPTIAAGAVLTQGGWKSLTHTDGRQQAQNFVGIYARQRYAGAYDATSTESGRWSLHFCQAEPQHIWYRHLWLRDLLEHGDVGVKVIKKVRLVGELAFAGIPGDETHAF